MDFSWLSMKGNLKEMSHSKTTTTLPSITLHAAGFAACLFIREVFGIALN